MLLKCLKDFLKELNKIYYLCLVHGSQKKYISVSRNYFTINSEIIAGSQEGVKGSHMYPSPGLPTL